MAKSKAKPKAQRATQGRDWREATLARMRALILDAEPEMIEERKWRKPSNGMAGIPVWSHDGIVCTGETYKDYVKLTFANGAGLPDPKRLFNASLDGGTRRAIDLREGEEFDESAFQALVRAAVAENTPRSRDAKSSQRSAGTKQAKPVKLLSGGNPQIAKAYGDAPVQAFIAAMPGWKRDVGRRLDAIITRTVPDVYKAVKWNSPFYGIAEGNWFLGFHCISRYVKVAFFRGTSLKPLPPVESKQKDVRYYHVHENEEIDEAQFARWVKQASQLPGERM